MTSKEHLTKTLEIIRERKWCRLLNFDQGSGAVGVFGAMRMAIGNLPWQPPQAPANAELIEMSKHLLKEINSIRDILGWEDAPDRTQAEVEAALQKAIDSCPMNL